jgi:hypothetical protein
MGEDNTTVQAAQAASLFAGEAWFDPIEAGIRERIRGFIEALFEEELTAALGRGRGERAVGAPRGYRNGTRERQLLGSFGPVQISVPRARMAEAEGGTREWRSAALPRYARMTRQVEALIAGAYLAGTNTRRVKRALAALFRGAVGKDVVSRTWRKVKADWDAWNRRDLAAGRPRRAARRAEAALGRAQHGRGKRSRVAQRPRRPDRPRPAHARVPRYRRRGRAGTGLGRAVARRARATLHRAQAS